MSKIIIQLQGGLVQDIFRIGTGRLTGAVVVDEDVEGSDQEDITTVKIKNGTYKACVHAERINVLPQRSDVEKIVNKYLKGR